MKRFSRSGIRCLTVILISPILALNASLLASGQAFLEWNQLSELPPVGNQSESLGVAGPYVGVHNDALIVAGGANFPKPYWEEDKVWHDDIWVLEKSGEWSRGGKLPRPLGYGASVSTPGGVICIGGNDATKTYNDVYRLTWDSVTKSISSTSLPDLPKTLAFTMATTIGSRVFVAGGTETNALSSALNMLWMLDMDNLASGWQELPGWPGPPRGLNILTTQNNGAEEQLFLISGRRELENGELEFLKDAYAYSPIANSWKRIADSPVCVMAGEAFPVGENHIFVVGGADGSLFHLADDLKDEHPGFPKKAWAYNALTDTWQEGGDIPLNHVTTQVAQWGGNHIIASGEIRPRVRTPIVWEVATAPPPVSFGALNWVTLILYLGGLIFIGYLCARGTKSTEDFYLGGQSIPWWAAGMSIFGTTLSAITYLALPARVYGTSWSVIILNAGIILVAPLIALLYVPRLRRMNAVTAYEFLESRFDLGLRLFGSASFIIFQLFRMGVVVFLPALALAAVTGFNLTLCILLMGLIATIYTAFGGIKAVIWTDVIQVVVLIGGALMALVIIVFSLEGGISTLLAIGSEAGKFSMPAMEWSWAGDALLVLILGGIFSNALVPYTSDQAVVQRYLTTPSEADAKKAIWTNALMAIPATLIFAIMGVALFVYYKTNPSFLGPLQKNDQILPWFVANQMPAGLAGLVIAGVFAATMSSLDSSMHSICTAVSNDFVSRFRDDWKEKDRLKFARFLVAGLGIVGTTAALIMSKVETGHMFDFLIGFMGLIGGPLAGLFLLGIFVPRANKFHAWIGLAFSLGAILLCKYATNLHGLLYGLIAISVCVGIGYISSALMRPKKLYLITFLALLTSAFCLLSSEAYATPPNVLLIVSEDNGQELGIYGEPYVQTPNLDKLASEGVLFKSAYVAQAGCSQSRASFLTGLYPHQNGQIGLATWKFRMYDDNTPNIVRSLKEAGYRTGIIGKLHINPESAFPFDFEAIGKSNFNRNDLPGYAREAKNFISAGEAPFFLSVNYPDAHRPFIPQVDGIPEKPLTGEDVKPLDYFGLDNPQLRQNTADHYNCMSRLDSLIGDLLQVLNESGKADHTIVVYIGDHGADMLRGKRTSYEGGTRIPFIVRWPGQTKTHHVSEELVSLVDLVPTLLDATGAKPIPNLPGRSLAPLMKGKAIVWRTHLFTEFNTHSVHNYYPQRTVRNKRYKLILNLMPDRVNPGYQFTNNRFFEELIDTINSAPEPIRSAYHNMERPPQFELYDLKKDPHEFNNLAEEPDYAEIRADLEKRLDDWRHQTHDPMLKFTNVIRLKKEMEACFVDGEPDKAKLHLSYTNYFFE